MGASLISIIVPCYNSQTYIESCAQSILNQTYKNLELILIDDGSTDDTALILKKIAESDDRVIVINSANQGVSHARNIGLSTASGNYVMFVDSDDYIDADLVRQLTLMAKRYKKADFIRYNFVASRKGYSNNLYEFKNTNIKIQDNYDSVMEHFLTSNQNIPTYSPLLFIKRSIYKNLRFNEDLSYMEDAAFYYDLLNKSSYFYSADMQLYYYRINERSATHDRSRLLRNIQSVLKLNQYINDKERSAKIVSLVDTQHINIILGITLRIYEFDRKQYHDTIKTLLENMAFIKMSSSIDYSRLNTLKRLYAFSLLHKKDFILHIILLALRCKHLVNNFGDLVHASF